MNLPTPRFRLSLTWQMLLAGVLGAWVGGLLGVWQDKLICPFVLAMCDGAGNFFLTGARALAVPLVFASIVLGAARLESMRGLGRLVWKTLLWNAAGSLLAIATGIVTVWLFSFDADYRLFNSTTFELVTGPPVLAEDSAWLQHPAAFGWLGLILSSLFFGFYRNQIEENHGRLLTRFCGGMKAVVDLATGWARPLLGAAVFVLSVSLAARQAAWMGKWNVNRELAMLAAGYAIYGLAVLPSALWLLTRLNPWRLLRAALPAVLLTLAGSPAEAALPLTYDRARRAANVSNRVASVTLPLGAALQRDGWALAWTVIGMYVHREANWGLTAGDAAAAWLLGCGIIAPAAARGFSAPLLALSLLASWHQSYVATGLVLAAGMAVSVLSNFCAAVVIAYSEGERGLLDPLPPEDPLASEDAPAASSD